MLKRYGIPTIYLLIVFICGMALGGFGYAFYEVRSSAARTDHPPPPEEWKKRYIKEMKTRLILTSEQTSKLSAILDESRVEYRGLMEKSRPEMQRIQTSQYAKVKAILTPAQVPEFEKFHAERERQRRGYERKGF